jgi:LemA protein
MEDAGVLTPRQAEMLRQSLGRWSGRGAKPPAPRRRRHAWLVPVALGCVALLVYGGMSGGEPGVQNVAETLNQPGAYGQMSKQLSQLLALSALLVVPLLMWVLLHNSLVSREERVLESWAQVESNFQRRADLIPGLVETVSRYVRHESETLTGVTRERTRAAESLAGAVEDLIQAEHGSTEVLRERGEALLDDEAALAKLMEAQETVGRTMTNLFAVAEDYPELRASDQFLELQAQIEGTENRINVARMRFNDAVRSYNGAIRKLPGSLLAQLGRFQRKAYFQSAEEARDAPALRFQ